MSKNIVQQAAPERQKKLAHHLRPDRRERKLFTMFRTVTACWLRDKRGRH
jgi:hypothetical protein